MDELLAKLERLTELIARRDALPHREIYSRAEACILLGGISRRTLDRMVALGEISTCPLGLKEHGGIPRSEIERKAAPKRAPEAPPPPKGGRRGPKPKAERSAKEEAAAIRALTRGR